MASFTDVISNVLAKSSDVQQIIDALKGTIGKGIPLSPTAVNDAIAYAFSAKNLDATNSRAGIFYKADGSVLLQIDKNGVQASPDGLAAAAPILTAAGQAALTNKTFDVNGTGNVLQLARGTAGNRPVAGTAGRLWLSTDTNTLSLDNGSAWLDEGLGSWTTFTPTLFQGTAVTLSTATGRYTRTGKLIVAFVHTVASAAGTASNAIQIGGMPVAPLTASGLAGHAMFLRAAASSYTLAATWSNVSTLNLYSGAGATGQFGVTAAITLASGDSIDAVLIYETA